ncbi:hypothetical protein M9H77_07959 [Catharanthus roseus]|uniref:Uncharacterized protein n=1 Tax=Catharanthus roseus TaxID=4058 RepID=A0ACC0BWQ4_CATRO|nr:hypothetical protein M9H77_07959 [Catharanthus roseus]
MESDDIVGRGTDRKNGESLKTLLFGNIHGFQFYHFHFKEFMNGFEHESFKGGVDGMTRKALGTREQGPVTRTIARRMEQEHQGKIAEFQKMTQDLAWQVIGDQEEYFKRSKTILWSSVQVEESKEANLGRLKASKTKGEPFLHPTVTGRLRVARD